MIVRQGETLTILNDSDKVIFYEPQLKSYHLMGETAVLVIGTESIAFVYYNEEQDSHKIVVDTNYKSVYVLGDSVAVYREIGMPIIDMYNQDLNHFLRLTKNSKGKWIHITRRFIPSKLVVTGINGYVLYGTIGNKSYKYHSITRRLEHNAKIPKSTTPMSDILTGLGRGD